MLKHIGDFLEALRMARANKDAGSKPGGKKAVKKDSQKDDKNDDMSSAQEGGFGGEFRGTTLLNFRFPSSDCANGQW